MEIKILINDKEVTVEEARKLWAALNDIFVQPGVVYHPDCTSSAPYSAVWTSGEYAVDCKTSIAKEYSWFPR